MAGEIHQAATRGAVRRAHRQRRHLRIDGPLEAERLRVVEGAVGADRTVADDDVAGCARSPTSKVRPKPISAGRRSAIARSITATLRAVSAST